MYACSWPGSTSTVIPGGGGAPSAVPADLDGIDGTVGGIAKRVAGLLLALVGLGVGLYVYGLRYLEPGAIGGF